MYRTKYYPNQYKPLERFNRHMDFAELCDCFDYKPFYIIENKGWDSFYLKGVSTELFDMLDIEPPNDPGYRWVIQEVQYGEKRTVYEWNPVTLLWEKYKEDIEKPRRTK